MNRPFGFFAFAALLLAFALPHAIAAGDVSETGKRDISTQIGRFSMVATADKVVLLDTATGDTWILETRKDSDGPSWRPLTGRKSLLTRTIAAARAASQGSVRVESVADTGVLILRGKKEDVEDAIDAVRRVENPVSGGTSDK